MSNPTAPRYSLYMSTPVCAARPMGARKMWSGTPKADTRPSATPRSSLHSVIIKRWIALACYTDTAQAGRDKTASKAARSDLRHFRKIRPQI